jgi:hypothetical protein
MDAVSENAAPRETTDRSHDIADPQEKHEKEHTSDAVQVLPQEELARPNEATAPSGSIADAHEDEAASGRR